MSGGQEYPASSLIAIKGIAVLGGTASLCGGYHTQYHGARQGTAVAETGHLKQGSLMAGPINQFQLSIWNECITFQCTCMLYYRGLRVMGWRTRTVRAVPPFTKTRPIFFQ